jgi:deoxycytidylate deaminase
MNRDTKYMAFVRRLAINNDMKMKLAACLVLNNEVISVGYNSDKSHPLQKRFAKNSDAIFKHAEVDCIINALRHIDKEDMKKTTLYVFRVKRKRKGDHAWVDGMAEPCPGCKRAIEHFGIKRVVYSTEESDPIGVITCQP